MNQSPGIPDYILIGHVTHDMLDDGTTAIGGTASYSALTAGVLGLSVGLLTSAGPDFDFSPLASVHEIVVRPSPVTTTFRNEYIDGTRQQTIYQVAQSLNPVDLPKSWQAPLIAHIAPIFEECDYKFLEHFDHGTYIGVTPQGWLRRKLLDGRVVPKLWKNGVETLRKASAVIISDDDIKGDWEYAEMLAESTSLLVVTRGFRGGFIYENNERVAFSAPKVNEYNPTGAGDIFAAAFFYAAAHGSDAHEASVFASCIAVRSVTRMGLDSIPTPDEVHQCFLKKPEG